MRTWVTWLINHNMRWVVYTLMIISFPFYAMFSYWLECYEEYFYTWKAVRDTKKDTK